MPTHNQRVFKFDLRTKKIVEIGKGGIGTVTVTSKPYAIEDEYTLQVMGPSATAELKTLLHTASIPMEKKHIAPPVLVSATLTLRLSDYPVPLEKVTFPGPTLASASLSTNLVKYDRWPLEKGTISGPILVSADLKLVLIPYTRWPLEKATFTGPTIASAVLTPKP